MFISNDFKRRSKDLMSLSNKNTEDDQKSIRKNIVSTLSPRVMKKLLPGRIQYSNASDKNSTVKQSGN